MTTQINGSNDTRAVLLERARLGRAMKATEKVKRVLRTIEFLEQQAAEILLGYTSEHLLAASSERFQIAGWLRADLGLPKREGACSVEHCAQPVGDDARHCAYHAKHPPAAECDVEFTP